VGGMQAESSFCLAASRLALAKAAGQGHWPLARAAISFGQGHHHSNRVLYDGRAQLESDLNTHIGQILLTIYLQIIISHSHHPTLSSSHHHLTLSSPHTLIITPSSHHNTITLNKHHNTISSQHNIFVFDESSYTYL